MEDRVRQAGSIYIVYNGIGTNIGILWLCIIQIDKKRDRKCKEEIASWYIPARPEMDYGQRKVKKHKFGACIYVLKALVFREVSMISKYHYVKSFRNMHLSNFQSF